MALHLISSNRVECLQAALALQMEKAPPPSPFDAEQVIVPGMAMARWVNLQLAGSLGIASNITYRLPAEWLWELMHDLLPEVPDRDPVGRETLAWRLFALLPGLVGQPECAPLSRYLQDDGDGVRRWQLAGRIADVFDRYQFYRPDWIRDWSAGGNMGAGREYPWQPLLWRAVIAETGPAHRVALVDRLPAVLAQSTDRLPERLSLFALSSLPPLFVSVFRELAGHIDVLFYQHSPTDQYWADLIGEKQAARQRLREPERTLYSDAGDELLVSWGRQGQAFQDLLLDSDLLDDGPMELYEPPERDCLLHQLQHRLYGASAGQEPLPRDDSLSVHVCHSPLRECQVLHDNLLRELEEDGSLKPEDILVMIPEISRYAPYVEAVFRRDENDNRPFIPWNLSDTTVADQRPLLLVFLELLELPDSRLPWSEVMSLLEVPEVAARFDLTGDDVDSLATALRRAGARWGLDAEHREALGLPPHPRNTWQHALDRLMAAQAMGPLRDHGHQPGDTLWQGVVAAREMVSPVVLGRFALLVDRLREWRGALSEERSATAWQEDINRLLEQFFRVSPDDDDPLQAVRDALGSLAESAGAELLSGAVLRQWLESQLGSTSQHGRYFSGGVTFCGMRPMRSMPFRVICLLGMDDAAFPRRDRLAEFDGMSADWRPGDPRKGDEDRYLMLETLLSARDRLYISYTGRSLQSNEPRQPSTLVQELMDQVNGAPAEGRDAGFAGTVYPMQPFSPDNFRSPGPVSHDQFWFRVARALEEPVARSGRTGDWPTDAIPLPDELSGDTDLGSLRRFVRNPVRSFFQDRLKIRLEEMGEEEDVEPFDLDGLQAWQLRQELISAALEERPPPNETLVAEGTLPHGAMADLVLEGTREATEQVLEAVKAYEGRQAETVHMTVPLSDGTVVSGTVSSWYAGLGHLMVMPSRFKGHQLLWLWLDHLALCASERQGKEEQSLLVIGDGRCHVLPYLAADEARSELEQLVMIYREGLRRPLPVAAASSYAMARQESRDDVDRGQQAAASCWDPDNEWSRGGDADDPYLRAVVHAGTCPPHEAEEFRTIAWRLYGPVARQLPEGLLP